MRNERIGGLLAIAGISLGGATPLAAQLAPQPAETTAQRSAEAADIVITATRKSEVLSKVPISVSAFTNQKLEVLGIKSFAEVAKFTPGVVFNEDRKDISIRGISSQAGTGTTGIYIDDTPIQVRALGLNANNTLPAVFDLERVEVLRGPQGTLFGAGSEGGTVRYITPQPGLDKYSGYARAELSGTEKGSPNYEAGVAIGGPIVQDKLGFRISGWYRRDGGYINRVDYQSLATTQKDANYTDTYVVRAAMTWAPTSSLSFTPAVVYQNRQQNNHDDYWLGISDPSKGRYLSGTPDIQADKDEFYLPSLKIEWTGDKVKLISNTSYYSRKEVVGGYSGTLYNLSLFQQLLDAQINFNGDPNPDQPEASLPLLTSTGINLPQMPGYVASVFITNKQQNFTQEVRLQSTDPNARLQWVLGGFFSSNRQTSIEEIYDPMLPALSPLLFGQPLDVFSQDSDGNLNPLLPNGDSYINDTVGKDRQIAVFADATYALTDQLKVSVGLRYAFTKFSFTNFADGPQNIGFSSGTGSKSEHPFTPKFNISYQATPSDLFYATVSKGYRIGGANPPFPQSACQADLDALQITNVPATYDSDTVWNYEIGAKNKLFDRRVTLSTSIYYLKWKNIQQANYLTSCGFQYTGNLGEVTSKGFDIQVAAAVTDQLSLDLSVGYTEARYSKTTLTGGPGSPALTTKGDTIPGTRPWTVNLGAEYDFQIGRLPAFLRADYEFASRNPWLTPIQDSANATSDPALVNDPATHLVSLRAGVTFDKLQAQAFVNNLLNTHPVLNLNHQDQFTELFEAQTLRPRTFGLSLSYRF